MSIYKSNSLNYLFLIIPIFTVCGSLKAQILTGAEQTTQYFPLLKEKRIGLVINPASKIKNTLLVDSLIISGFKIKKIFFPEHGFRGNADAGEALANFMDKPTGLPAIALYGKHIMPDSADLSGLDLIVFDLQDVGVRFYTYLSTLHYVIKACAHYGIPLLILDRPNPNAALVEGPVLESAYSSFVGLDPVPILYGMTIGEYGQMLSGENWIHEIKPCRLRVIPIANYNHSISYSLPTIPSPNLPNDRAIALYPSLCLFEGTQISVGRGTDFPFQVFGSPDLEYTSFCFKPVGLAGKSKHPLYEDRLCYGYDLSQIAYYQKGDSGYGLNLGWLIKAYQNYTGIKPFFNSYFNKLAGNTTLRYQIEMRFSAQKIQDSWKPGLTQFLAIRKKYLIYP